MLATVLFGSGCLEERFEAAAHLVQVRLQSEALLVFVPALSKSPFAPKRHQERSDFATA